MALSAIPRFEMATAGRIVFGCGVADEVGALARDLGRHALLVSGRTSARGDRVRSLLSSAGIATTTWTVSHEPTLATIEEGVAAARTAGCDLVVAVGGGSVLDSAKAVAALAAIRRGALLDHLEVIGGGAPLTHPSLPCIAMPTTAGTGSEVTRNAVLASPEHRVKVSLRSPLMLPRLAIVDPELTFDLPPALTASHRPRRADAGDRAVRLAPGQSGDGCVVCRWDAPRRDRCSCEPATTGATARRASRCRSPACTAAWRSPTPASAPCTALPARSAACSTRRTAPSAPRSSRTSSPATSVRSTHAQPIAPCDARFDEVGRLLTGRPGADAEDGVRWLLSLVAELQIPPLRHYGVTSDHVDAIVDQSTRASSMKGNPIDLTRDELTAILTAAI